MKLKRQLFWCIWQFSEWSSISLGRFAPFVFSQMTGLKGKMMVNDIQVHGRRPTADGLTKFPPGTRLIIDVVFEQYRVGWIYGNKNYIPGVGSYYPFEEAVERATAVFNNLFPGEMIEAGEGQHEGG